MKCPDSIVKEAISTKLLRSAISSASGKQKLLAQKGITSMFHPKQLKLGKQINKFTRRIMNMTKRVK